MSKPPREGRARAGVRDGDDDDGPDYGIGVAPVAVLAGVVWPVMPLV